MIYSFIYIFSVKGETKKTFERLSPPGGFVQRNSIFTFCLTNICKMLNIRIDSETKEMLAYLRLHNVRFQPNLRKIIKAELSEIYKDFKINQKRIKDAPDWLHE